MGIFNKSGSIESRLAEAEQNLVNEQTHSAELEAELKSANEKVSTAEGKLAEAQATAGKIMKASATQAEAMVEVVSIFASSLGLTNDEVAALDQEKLSTKINELAYRKAVEIAASQGAPPVRTDSAMAGNDQDEVKLAFETAAQEPDPLKRAKLFSKARKMVK